ncbi:MAG: nitrite reductase small subunit NirD [Deltaproteobacteria bacterium]|nr:nitrite reductase small subunit NirD [Deltaproteobacteria bacterium]
MTKSSSRVVVVGNGMVSHRFCERLVEHDRAGRYRLVVCGEEPRPAYDRVHLTEYFAHGSADQLSLGSAAWYADHGIELRVGTRVASIDRGRREVATSGDQVIAYDALVLATGSAPFVPAIPGIDKPGAFVYRTIEDLDAILSWCQTARRAAVIGGGLLGLEAARAVLDAGLETHVFEVAPRLMPRQLDTVGAALLETSIRELGVHVHLGAQIAAIGGDGVVRRVELVGQAPIEVDIVIVSAGIRPRDELARAAGIAIGERGGVIVDDRMCTNDPDVFAIGEVALHAGTTYGLVAPGYEMAEVLAKRLSGHDAAFTGADQSAKLKLLGTEVASFGDPFRDAASTKAIAYEDQVRGVYQKLVLTRDGAQLVGGILVGDTSDYGRLLHLARSRQPMTGLPMFGAAGGACAELPDDAQVCSCNNVAAQTIRERIRTDSLATVAEVKLCTRAGSGCGGCIPIVTDLLQAELARCGRATKQLLCEHFAFTRQELFQIVAATRIRTFEELVRDHGSGLGCEVCKPTVASILASIHNEPILDEPHRPLQDSNDRFLANIQKDGTYSVVPRIPAGEVTPDQLITIGRVGKKYGLYTKITGGQRIDLFGARVEQLPEIWEELVAAGFESGHAYGKAVRTVKSCVGTNWCRFGVQDSTAFAIRIEHRYKGIRSPHKLKSAVSGCIRECAEAQSKDFGLIATESGWNVYVCGNGGSKPRHADLLTTGVDEDTAIRFLDRFLMFYIRTADRLMRTSVWLDKMDGGIEHLRDVIVRDSLGIGVELEQQMQGLVDTYACEWKGVLQDPAKRALFRPDPVARVHLPIVQRQFVRLASVSEVPRDGSIAVTYGDTQIAIFHVSARNEWYATQNSCPHTQAMVLARGIVGDAHGTPKVACPLHKKTFDLRSGDCLSADAPSIAVFPVRIEDGGIYVELPPVAEQRS